MTRAGDRAKAPTFVALARVVHAVPLRRGRAGARRRSATLARQAHVPILVRQRSGRARRQRRRRSTTRRFWSAPTARPAASIARCTSCRSASTCRSRSCCSSPRRSSRRCRTSRPATRPTLLPVGGHLVSTAICYEVVYPDLVRQFVAGGSELLTTITNDAWFGATSAPYQHFEQASMRAIEEGRYLVRSANTGISGIVDPYGRVLARTGDLRAGGRSSATARFLTDAPRSTRGTATSLAYARRRSLTAALAASLAARRRVQ